MNKEYFLISRKMKDTEEGRKDEYFVIDKFVCNGIKEAEKEFSGRNYKKMNEEWIIVKSERWIN